MNRGWLACHAWTSVFLLLLASTVVPGASAAEKKEELRAGPDAWVNDLTPITVADWSRDRAAHLLERAGFGGSPDDIDRLATMTPEAAVKWLVEYQKVDNSHLQPFDESGIYDPPVEPFPKSRPDATRLAKANGEAMGVKVKPSGDRPLQPVVNRFFYWLRADYLEIRRAGQWWAQRMLTTHRPLEEKLALFWHGHFATSDDKVRDYRKLLKQLALFHKHGNGNFRDLLIGVAKDPAMLVFLDAGDNIKGRPNENFGREILELFTMGVGHYTETDIREAARAFTGWTNDSLNFVVKADLHDDGEKTFLGRRGNFDGVGIIDIILEQEVTARFIAGKLYRFFVRDDPSPELIAKLGTVFRDKQYEIAPVLTTMFLSRDFYSPPSYATQIKSPVQLVVSTYKKLGLTEIPGVPDFDVTTRDLGQELFHPPNVAGWKGGRSWITPAILLQRGDFVREVLFPDFVNFQPPDRQMPETNREVARKIAQGYDITKATIEVDKSSLSSENSMAMFNMMADADEGFNTRYGSTVGWMEAFRRVKPIPRQVAQLSLTQLVINAKLHTTSEAVDYFLARFLRAPLAPEDRRALTDFLTTERGADQLEPAVSYLEEPLRLLVHLIMSAPENTSKGTDHGTATPMFVIGEKVKGGLYGTPPRLTNLDDGNLIYTTDFRRVYATMINEWLGYRDTASLLKGDFQTLDLFT